MNDRLKGVIENIGTEYKAKILKGSRHYKSIQPGTGSGLPGFQPAVGVYRCGDGAHYWAVFRAALYCICRVPAVRTGK